MQIQQNTVEFQPVTVTLETQAEVNSLFNVVLVSQENTEQPLSQEEGEFALSVINMLEPFTTSE